MGFINPPRNYARQTGSCTLTPPPSGVTSTDVTPLRAGETQAHRAWACTDKGENPDRPKTALCTRGRHRSTL